MKFTFLGHQGWLIESGQARVIVDPVLRDGFGSTTSRFVLFPMRKARWEQLGRVDAVLLTTEHLQHFDPESLTQFAPDTPVFVGPMFAESAVRALSEEGLVVRRMPCFEASSLAGALGFRFLPAGPDTSAWDRRTNSLLLESMIDGGAVLIQSDVAPSDALSAVRTVRSDLAAVICTNNSQIPIWPGRGAWANQAAEPCPRSRGPVGVQLMTQLFSSFAGTLDNFPALILNGNGHVLPRHAHGPFLWGSDELASTANQLSLGQEVFGPDPGETFLFEASQITRGKCDWLTVDQERMALFDEEIASMAPPPRSAFVPESQVSLSDLEPHLRDLVAPLMMSELGRSIASTNELHGEKLSAARFALSLLGPEPALLSLDVAKAEWVKLDPETEDLGRYPAGVEVFAGDLAAVFDGTIQIWELCSTSFRQWSVGSMAESPTAFLYAYFDEVNRNDLSARNYQRRLAKRKQSGYPPAGVPLAVAG